MNQFLKVLGSIVLALALVVPAMVADYDLVIRNSRVMDRANQS
jgi:hypothetical protein